MRSKLMMVSAAVMAALAGGQVLGAQLIVYPAQGQSPQQQQKDEGECYVWAKNYTGIDPAAGVPASAPPPADNGQVAKGVVRGAAGGAIIGQVSGGNAGHGAAAGAVMGGLMGAARKQKSQQQAAQQAQQSQGAAMQQFQNANAACLQGKGYTVK